MTTAQQLREALGKLEREASAGRALAEAVKSAGNCITQNGTDCAIRDALSAYHTACGKSDS